VRLDLMTDRALPVALLGFMTDCALSVALLGFMSDCTISIAPRARCDTVLP
jgi:hypothetical protein